MERNFTSSGARGENHLAGGVDRAVPGKPAPAGDDALRYVGHTAGTPVIPGTIREKLIVGVRRNDLDHGRPRRRGWDGEQAQAQRQGQR